MFLKLNVFGWRFGEGGGEYMLSLLVSKCRRRKKDVLLNWKGYAIRSALMKKKIYGHFEAFRLKSFEIGIVSILY